MPPFATTTGDPREYGERLKALVARQGIALDYDRSIAPALGVSSGGRIRLMPDLPAAEEFAVLSHELAHEMLHHPPERAALPKVVRETQAEAVAYVVCRGVGLETHTAAADYIALYSGDSKTLAASLSVIQETSARILKDLLPEERARSTPSTRDVLEPATPPSKQGPTSREPDRPRVGPDPLDSVSMDR